MKILLLLFVIIHFSLAGNSQDSKKITIRADSVLSDYLTYQDRYSYPQFIEGRVSFKDGAEYSARLNYNLLTGQLQFINRKGDTLELANESTIKSISIGQDTFFYDKGYYRLLEGHSDYKLAVQQRLVVVDKQKVGAFGQPSSGAGIETVDRIVQTNKLTLMENTILSRVTRYYLGNRFNHYVPFTRKSVLKTFSDRQNDIKKYLDQSSIDFNKQEDLIKVVAFLQNLGV